MKRCATCRWWHKGSTNYEYGTCKAISVKGDQWPHCPGERLAKCTGSYDDGCVPDNMDLQTKPDFGCTLHEEKT